MTNQQDIDALLFEAKDLQAKSNSREQYVFFAAEYNLLVLVEGKLKHISKVFKSSNYDIKDFSTREGELKLYKDKKIQEHLKILKPKQIPYFEDKIKNFQKNNINLDESEKQILIQKEIEYLLNIESQDEQQLEKILDIVLHNNLQNLKNNMILCQICFTQFQVFEEPEGLFDRSQFFEINGQKYFKENKINIKNFILLLLSQFKLDISIQSNLQEQLESQNYLSPSNLPPLLDYYNIYFYDQNLYTQYDIKNMILPNQIVKIGFCNYQFDFLPGYNMYLQLSNQIIFISAKKAIDISRIYYGIKNSIIQYQFLVDNYLKFDYKQALMLYQQLKVNNFENFLKVNRKILKIHFYKLNENFNLDLFEKTLSIMKKIIKLFQYSTELNSFKQQFTAKYHYMISSSLCRTQFEFDVNKMNKILQLMKNYQKVLYDNQIEDIYLDKFLNSFATQLEDKWIDQIQTQMNKLIKQQLIQKEKNFYKKVFEVFIMKNISEKNKQEMKAEVFIKSFKLFIQNIKDQILRHEKINLSDYLDWINQNLKFFGEFSTFYNNHRDYFESGFIENIQQQNNFIQNIYSLFNFCITRLQQTLEKKIQDIFYNQEFFKIDIKKQLEQVWIEFSGVEKSLNIYVKENLFYGLLHFLLQYYFASSFKCLTGQFSRSQLLKKFSEDCIIIEEFFKLFLKEDNLNALLLNFQYYNNLFERFEYRILLSSLLKFNLLFKNRLCTEIVISILQQNCNITLSVEEELINFYNTCNREHEEKNKLEPQMLSNKDISLNDSFFQKSRIIYNSQKIESNTINYLPNLSMKSFVKIKIHVTKFRLKQLLCKLDQSIILSDFQPQQQDFMENNDTLENIIKLIIIEEEKEQDNEDLDSKLKDQKYEKLQAILSNNQLQLYNLENNNKIFDVDLMYISSIKKLHKNFITFKFKEKQYYMNYPTKNESLKWFENLKFFKNQKKQFNLTQQIMRTDYFKIDYIFKSNYQKDSQRVDMSLLIPYNVELFYSLKKIHNFLADNSRKFQQRARRKSIDINELWETEEQSRILTNLDIQEEIEDFTNINRQESRSISEDDENYFSDDEQQIIENKIIGQ